MYFVDQEVVTKLSSRLSQQSRLASNSSSVDPAEVDPADVVDSVDSAVYEAAVEEAPSAGTRDAAVDYA